MKMICAHLWDSDGKAEVEGGEGKGRCFVPSRASSGASRMRVCVGEGSLLNTGTVKQNSLLNRSNSKDT